VKDDGTSAYYQDRTYLREISGKVVQVQMRMLEILRTNSVKYRGEPNDTNYDLLADGSKLGQFFFREVLTDQGVIQYDTIDQGSSMITEELFTRMLRGVNECRPAQGEPQSRPEDDTIGAFKRALLVLKAYEVSKHRQEDSEHYRAPRTSGPPHD